MTHKGPPELEAECLLRAWAELDSLPDFQVLDDQIATAQPLLWQLVMELVTAAPHSAAGPVAMKALRLLWLAHQHGGFKLPELTDEDVQAAADKVAERISYLKDEPDAESRALAITSLPDNAFRAYLINMMNQEKLGSQQSMTQLLMLSFETFLEACRVSRT